MSYKGYSFNLHKEDDGELIEWLVDKKITKTIKIALYNQMRSESENVIEGNSIELLSVIKKAIENSNEYNERATTIETANKKDDDTKKNNNDKSLSDEDADDFEKIFDV